MRFKFEIIMTLQDMLIAEIERRKNYTNNTLLQSIESNNKAKKINNLRERMRILSTIHKIY